ncbi:MAG TPA: hypothetical protein VFS07_01890 [Gemmatimonadales bacterium]|nr:hypothetical protein [Gemmatimonadales bacterium]
MRSLLATAALVGGLTAFTAPRTAPVTGHYRISEVIDQVVDLSAVGGGEQTTHLVTSTFVTLSTTDSAGGRAVRMVIDSARGDTLPEGAGIDPARWDSLRGGFATAFLDANGKLTAGPADSSMGGMQARALLREFFPRMQARARTGDHWTDTTEFAAEGSGAPGSTRRVTNWAVTGEEARGGVRARKVEGAYSQSSSGQVESPNGPMTVDGTGTGTLTYYVGPDGRHLGAASTLAMQLSITMAQAPEPIPVRVSRSATITPLP